MSQEKSATNKPEVKAVSKEPKPHKPLTLVQLQQEIDSLEQRVQAQFIQMIDIQEALARKRKPVPNGKVQIKDKQTGKVYPSKNNCYQSLLKGGELKDLIDKGIFGDNPEKNTFGWYALVREWPDRFEEVKAEQQA